MYIDVLFVFNFMMDFLVLLFASFLCRMHCADQRLRAKRWKKMCAAAAAGAAGSCFIEAVRLVGGMRCLATGFGALLAGIVLCAGMTWIAFRPRTVASACRRMLAVYAGAFLIGGVCSWLQVHMETMPYGALLLASVGMCMGFREMFWRIQSVQARIVEIRIFCGGDTVCVKGLVDTGNSLTLTGTQTPVSVIDAGCVLPALTQAQRMQYQSMCETFGLKTCATHRAAPLHDAVQCAGTGNWQLIVYHSVGCARGMLPAFCAAHVYIKTENRELHQERMWLALSPEPVSKQYDMLLHPAHVPLDC